jgi:c-di-GMP-binding flagellar brake protein YcgR
MSTESRTFLITYLSSAKTPDSFKEVLPKLGLNPKIRSQKMSSVQKMITALNAHDGGLCIFFLSERTDLSHLVNFLSLQGDAIHNRTVYPIVFDLLNSASVSDFLRRQPGLVLLDKSATSQTLVDKIQQGFKTVYGNNQLQSEKREEQQEISWLSPLKEVPDYWLVSNKTHVRRIMGRWLIELSGPSPNAGLWEAVEIPGMGAGFAWRPRATSGIFHHPKGEWVFFGRRPELDATTSRWRFVHEQPKLIYFKDGKPNAYRINAIHAGSITVSENPTNAQAIWAEIQATYEVLIKASATTTQVSAGKTTIAAEPVLKKNAGSVLQENTETTSSKLEYSGKSEEKPREWNQKATEEGNLAGSKASTEESVQVKTKSKLEAKTSVEAKPSLEVKPSAEVKPPFKAKTATDVKPPPPPQAAIAAKVAAAKTKTPAQAPAPLKSSTKTEESPHQAIERYLKSEKEDSSAVGLPSAFGKNAQASVTDQVSRDTRLERLRFLSQVSQHLEKKKTLFSLITKSSEKKSYFKEAEENFCPAVLWTRNQEFRMDSRVYDYNAKTEKVSVTLSPQLNDAAFTQIVGNDKATVLFVHINTRRAPVFIVTNAREARAKGRTVGFPASHDMYEVQRRGYFRAQFLEDQGFTASIDLKDSSKTDRKSLSYPIVNLSGTGLAFVADIDEQSLLEKGKKIILRFTVNSVELKTTAEVRWNKQLGTVKKKIGLLVGVQFLDFNENTTKELNLYALEQSYEYLKRYIDPVDMTPALPAK